MNLVKRKKKENGKLLLCIMGRERIINRNKFYNASENEEKKE